MEKKQFDKLRLETKMNEMFVTYNSTVYASTKSSAKATLDALQEEYKSKFGEYSEKYLVKESAAKYASMSIDQLIKSLEDLKGKHGGECNIELDGTLMCQKDGNTIILSNKAQM